MILTPFISYSKYFNIFKNNKIPSDAIDIVPKPTQV